MRGPLSLEGHQAGEHDVDDHRGKKVRVYIQRDANTTLSELLWNIFHFVTVRFSRVRL